MKKDKKNTLPITRRRFLPLLGGALLPLLGMKKITELPDEEFETLLTKDGTAVRVKKSTVQQSKVVEKNVSNKSLLGWLNKKDENL